MSMDLLSEAGGRTFHLNNLGWGNLLQLALTNRWKPERPADFYLYNDGQTVSDIEARALAHAIEQALPDVPDFDAMAHKTGEVLIGEHAIRVLKAEVNACELFSGENKDLLREFVQFARNGAFQIW